MSEGTFACTEAYKEFFTVASADPLCKCGEKTCGCGSGGVTKRSLRCIEPCKRHEDLFKALKEKHGS